MPTLTSSYKIISTISTNYGEIRTYGKYTGQSMEDNCTYYRLKQTYYLRQYINTSSATGTLDGSVKKYGYTHFPKGETTIQEVSRTLYHRDDGSSPTVGVTTKWSAAFGGGGSKTVDIRMPSIDRLATVNNATDFTDETTPTVTFSNPGGFTTKPYINIYDNSGEVIYDFYRDQNVTSPYTWTFTDAEKTAMRKACNKQNKYKCTIGVDTYSGSTKLGFNSVEKTMTIVNAEPSATYTLTEENAKVSALITSVSSIVENTSQIKVSVTPTALKEATIKNVILTNGANEISKSSSPYEYTFNIQSSNVFRIKVIDSRNNTKEYTITKTLINYKPVAINSFKFKRENPTSSNIYLTADITYYQTTFGTTTNASTIKYKMGESGTLRTLTTSDYTLDNTNHKITITDKKLIDTLPYNQEQTFYLYVEDKLSTATDSRGITKGIPTFDAGSHDFQVNGDLFVADTNRQNPVNVLDAIFYKSGDTLQIPSGYAIIPASFITAGKTEIYFNIYTPKLMTNINKITITGLIITGRQNGNYIMGDADGGLSVNVSTWKVTDNCIRCLYKSSSAISNATNNSPVGLVLSSGTITFTYDNTLSADDVNSDIDIV